MPAFLRLRSNVLNPNPDGHFCNRIAPLKWLAGWQATKLLLHLTSTTPCPALRFQLQLTKPKGVTIAQEYYLELLDNLFDGAYIVDRDRVITHWNEGAVRITGYGSPDVVGKRCSDSVLVHIDEKGTNLCDIACPLKETIDRKRSCQEEVYLLHKDGHRVPVTVRTLPLRDAGGKVIGGIQVFKDNSPRVELLQRIEELQEMALLDPLTKIGNRRYADLNLSARLSELDRYAWEFGVMFIDIDNFKKVNDVYGHEIGDEVLKMVTKTISVNLRSFDFLGRWGGEEFVAIIPNFTREQLLSVAERCRVLIAQSSFPVGSDRACVTVSIGATLARPDDTTEILMRRVDQRMYQSKEAGRNHVTIDEPGSIIETEVRKLRTETSE